MSQTFPGRHRVAGIDKPRVQTLLPGGLVAAVQTTKRSSSAAAQSLYTYNAAHFYTRTKGSQATLPPPLSHVADACMQVLNKGTGIEASANLKAAEARFTSKSKRKRRESEKVRKNALRNQRGDGPKPIVSKSMDVRRQLMHDLKAMCIAEQFTLLDLDGSGGISKAEFLAAFGPSSGAEFDAVDADMDGELSKKEYIAAYGNGSQMRPGCMSKAEVEKHRIQNPATSNRDIESNQEGQELESVKKVVGVGGRRGSCDPLQQPFMKRSLSALGDAGDDSTTGDSAVADDS